MCLDRGDRVLEATKQHLWPLSVENKICYSILNPESLIELLHGPGLLVNITITSPIRSGKSESEERIPKSEQFISQSEYFKRKKNIVSNIGSNNNGFRT